MDMEEARGFVFQALREPGLNQFGHLLSSVGFIKARAQHLSVQPQQVIFSGSQLLADYGLDVFSLRLENPSRKPSF
jgi:hypothetical protein